MSKKGSGNFAHTHTHILMFTHKPLFTINAEAYWFFFIFLFSDDKFCPKKSFMKYKGHLKIPNVIDYSKDLARQITHVIGIAMLRLVAILLAT